MKATNAANAIVNQQDLKSLFTKIVKNWHWMVVFLIVCGVGSFVYLKKATHIYGASTKILVKDQKSTLQEAMSKSFEMKNMDEDVNNEMEILKSSRLIRETVNRLRLDVSYFIKGRLRTGEIYQGIPFSVMDAKVLDASFYNIPFNIHIINSERYSLEVVNEDYNYSRVFKFGEPVVNEKFSFIITGKTEQIENNPRLSEINYQFRINNTTQLVEKYRKALKLERDFESTVISVSISDEIPERAVAFLDTLTRLYIEHSVSVQREINDKTLQFIEEQLQDVADILNSVESNLEQFQRQTGTVSTGEQSATYIQQKADVENELSKLMVQMRSVDYLYDNLTSGSDITAISPSLFSDESDPALAQAFIELSNLVQRRNSLLFSNTPNSPVVRELDQQIETRKKNVLEMILNLRRSLYVKYNGLNAQLNALQSRISHMPATMKGLVNINRKVAINEKIYLFLLETKAQTIIARASIVPDKTIIEPATSTGLIKPIKSTVIFSGIGIALALSFVVIFLKSLFYNYISTKEDITAITHLPVVGVVGKSKEARESYLVAEKYPNSLTTEAFRVIRTNLSFYTSRSPSKVILITSTHPSEGKTFCAINIASLLARAKKKTVLIDLDLHKPKQANVFNIKNDTGVSTFLAGRSSFNEIIHENSIENLHLILSGPHTPNASELIHEKALEEMIEELRKRYEYIILDTPPVGLLSDTLYLMQFSDVNLYVLKASHAKPESVELAMSLVEKHQIKSLGFILNGVHPKNIPAGYGGNYYYRNN
jgi:capsular exopolysaccharide synthesis family protein